jgi:hypothetical protein
MDSCAFFMNSGTMKIFEQALLLSINKNEAIVRPSDIPQWQANDNVIEEETFVQHGFFINFYTPAPTFEEMTSILEKFVEHTAASQCVIPCIRETGETTALLRQWGFLPGGEGVESLFTITLGVDQDLRERVGSKRYRDIIRMAKRANEIYSFEIMDTALIDDEMLARFQYLSTRHCQRHGTAINIYNQYVQDLMRQAKNTNFKWFIRRDSQGKIMQFGNLAICSVNREIYYLNQAIDHDMVSSNINLYVSSFYEVFLFAENNNYKEIHLGRGGVDNKLKVGATKQFLQHHWVISRKTAEKILKTMIELPIISKKNQGQQLEIAKIFKF